MVVKLTSDDSPDFNTLSGIMEYFNKVPFETFKEKLNEWFIRELPDKRPDLVKYGGGVDLPPNLFNLIEQIFKMAEEKDQSRLN
jgi:hypothetical protein